MNDQRGYLSATIETAIGKMRQERYASRGRSPSHADIVRATLMSKLKEEVRTAYNEDPDQRVDSKGNLVKIELTDGRCEDLAHARPEYQEYVRKTNAEHKRIAQLGRDLGPLYDRIEFLRGKKEALLQCVFRTLDKLHRLRGVLCIISGHCKQPDEHGRWVLSGVDRWAEEWACARGVPVMLFDVTPGEWKTLGKSAGPIRNRRMVDEGVPDLCVRWPGGGGTEDCASYAHERGVLVWDTITNEVT